MVLEQLVLQGLPGLQDRLVQQELLVPQAPQDQRDQQELLVLLAQMETQFLTEQLFPATQLVRMEIFI
jgi:hypothetical protein